METTSRETEHETECCAYCQNEMPEDGWQVPAVDDDDAWERHATYHAQGCEWVVTRAFRLAQ